MDAAGNLYGTTLNGGTASGSGVVFKLAPDGTQTVLYSFCPQSSCADGAMPRASLLMDAPGNLYGTTFGGGAQLSGVVFKLAPDGTETVLYSFCPQSGCADGAQPAAGLIMDAAGNLYGTTLNGGIGSGSGVVFKLAPDGTETVLYSFCSQANCTDGQGPQAGLLMDAAGNLYGTTVAGGTGFGVVFKLAPDGTETVLYSFCSQANCTDGFQPFAGLIMDAAGNLYGTTARGGTGFGVVFKLAPDGTETVLYSFCSQANCADGAQPVAGLIMDAAGNLYGTTLSGGTSDQGVKLDGGVVFALAPDGTETVLHTFCSPGGNCTDGARPGGLIMDAAGNLDGTTAQGGIAPGSGVVFALTP
jgi:uncharacterized repeat protein (TIGR03803 family)